MAGWVCAHTWRFHCKDYRETSGVQPAHHIFVLNDILWISGSGMQAECTKYFQLFSFPFNTGDQERHEDDKLAEMATLYYHIACVESDLRAMDLVSL